MAVKLLFIRTKLLSTSIESVHKNFTKSVNTDTAALDLGCGDEPKNLFFANSCIGLDLHENHAKNVYKVKLGFEAIPFPDNHFDYITAYDFLEHIPRYSELNSSPFIFLMNEIYRVLKMDGIFLSVTPIYPFPAAFQDPTHNNIITSDTFDLYFSKNKLTIATNYGINTNFDILLKRMHASHLVAVLKK